MKIRNIYTFLLLSLFLIPAFGVRSQTKVEHLEDHKPLMNKTWETIDQLMYKVSTQNGKTNYTPYFPPGLKALDGKKVSLSGYLIPIYSGRRHSTFLLSVLPINQCMFCGQNGIPPMVEVTMEGTTKLAFESTPISLQGIIYLNGKDETRAEVQLYKAIKIAGNR